MRYRSGSDKSFVSQRSLDILACDIEAQRTLERCLDKAEIWFLFRNACQHGIEVYKDSCKRYESVLQYYGHASAPDGLRKENFHGAGRSD